MTHYFSQEEPEKSNPKTFKYNFNSNTYIFATDTGVFSYGKMDEATNILLRNIPALTGSLLDIGCGYGPIGIVLAKEYNLELTQWDINPRAVQLTKLNAKENGVISNVVHLDVMQKVMQKDFDTVVINPPIHAGKDVIFTMYDKAHKYLKPAGNLYIVILKKHGAQSSITYLTKIFGNCHIIYKKKGCYILECER